MAAVIGTLRAELTATIAQFQRDLGKAADSVKAMSKEFTKVSRDFQQTGRQMQSVGTALTKTITLPILGFGLAAAKASIQFESAFSNVAKTVDGVSDKSGKLTQAGKALAQTFRDMAKAIPATTDELTAIAALGGQMGVPIAQLETFTEHVAALGVAVDGLSTEEAAAGLASIGNATGTGTTKIAEMSSALVHLGNNSNATEAQILEFTKRLVGAGHAVGMSVPEVMALGTAMANVGINAEAGGTAMSTVISKMSSAVSAGGQALEEFARVANMSGEQFAAQWKSKPIEAVDAFVRGLSSMRERGVDLNLTMGELGTEGIRVADTLKRLSGAGDGVGKALAFANEGFETANKHLEEAERKYATTANQLKILWNRIYDIGITLGTAFKPAIDAAIKGLEQLLPYVDKLAKAFADMPGSVQLAVLAIGGIAAAAGPAIWGIGQLISSIGQIAGAFGKGGVASRGMIGAVNGLKRALEAMRNVSAGSGAFSLLASGSGWLITIGTMYAVAGKLADDFKASLEEQAAAAKAAGTPIVGLRTGLKTLADAEEAAAQHGQDLVDGLEITVPALAGLATASGTGASAVKNFGEKLAAAQAELDTFAKEQPKAFADFVVALQSGHFEMEELEKQTALSKLAIDLYSDSLDRNKTATKDATEAAKEQKEELGFVRDEFWKIAQAIAALNEAAENEELAEQYRQAAREIEFINTQVGEWTDRSEEVEAALSDIYRVAGQVNDTFKDAIPLTTQIGENLKKTFQGLPKLISDALTGGGGLLGAAKAFGVQLADAILQPLMAELTTVFAAFFRKLGAQIAGQVTGAAVASSASAAIAGTAAASTAAAAGGAAAGGGAAAAGAGGAGIIGGLSMAQAVPIAGGIALAAYGVYRGLKALKEQAAHKEVNRLREAFFKMQGGLESLNPRVQLLTGNVKAVQAVFDARNPEQYNAALANLNAILEEGQRQFAELQTEAGTVSERLEGLTTITPDVQKALDAVFDANTPEGYLRAIQNLNKELDEQEANYRGIEDAMAKYGIAFEDAGKSFQQAKLNERAQELIRDFKLLAGSGIDINAQMRGMGKSINDFVRDAKKAGVEVPEAMREIIQVAIDAGEVFDEDGTKITDINQLGLTFGTTMETAMKKVETAVDRLTLVLEGLAKFLGIELPKAAQEGADKTNAALDTIEDKEVTVTVKHQEIPADMPPPGLPGPGVPGEPAPGAAHGAWVKPWGLQHLAGGGFAARGTDTIPAMLTPGELVLNHDQQRALFGAQAAVVVNLSIAIDGVFSEGDLVQTVQRRVAPILAQTIEDNVAGSRTRFQDVLGVP